MRKKGRRYIQITSIRNAKGYSNTDFTGTVVLKRDSY